MQTIVYILIALAMGAMLSIYLPMNSAVSKHLGSVITANITFFFVALMTSVAIFLFWGEHRTIQNVSKVPMWLYLTGVVSAVMILGATFLIPRIGVRQFFILTVSGQILAALIVSHYGFLGTPTDVITIKKSIGALLVVVGLVFSTL
jgi:transporter family-2 protein